MCFPKKKPAARGLEATVTGPCYNSTCCTSHSESPRGAIVRASVIILFLICFASNRQERSEVPCPRAWGAGRRGRGAWTEVLLQLQLRPRSSRKQVGCSGFRNISESPRTHWIFAYTVGGRTQPEKILQGLNLKCGRVARVLIWKWQARLPGPSPWAESEPTGTGGVTAPPARTCHAVDRESP